MDEEPMGRVLSIILVGLMLGVVIVASIGFYGIQQSQREQAAAVVERQWADRRVGKGLPVALELWRDGYETGLKLDKWSSINRRALSAFLSDWELFPALPSIEGSPNIDPEALEYIHRRHDRTKPQFIIAERTGCKVWIDRPQAQEVLEWNGECSEGFASGPGVLFRKFIRLGQSAEAGFSGEMIAGKSTGQGRTWLPSGYVYEGGHRDGQFHGHGVLTAPEQHEIYTGSFWQGYPHGLGELATPNKAYVGGWSKGCFVDGDVWASALRHRFECFGGDKFDGALDTLADILQ